MSVVIAVVALALVVAGFSLGFELDNLHNGMLAVSFTLVGLYVVVLKPRHREGWLFVAVGLAETVLFFGRQYGLAEGPLPAASWIGWAGVWPLALTIALFAYTMACFPDGRLPSPRWRLPVWIMFAIAGVMSLLNLLWPADYDRTGLVAPHPLEGLPGAALAATAWGPLQGFFLIFQMLPVVATIVRWRGGTREERWQLRTLVLAILVATALMLVGLAAFDRSPLLGLLSIPIVPIAGGVVIAHQRQAEVMRDTARRIVNAEDSARKRIERDLHDGAQQRLVSLAMSLGSLEAKADPAMAGQIKAAREQLLTATAELRELARGVHPAVLTESGLAAALEALADRSPIPVRLSVSVGDALPREVETTAYFVAAEALTNAARYAGATVIEVQVRRQGGEAVVRVSDDGRGGAVVRTGGGLQGLADRTTALGGLLSVASQASGTTVTVVLPVDDAQGPPCA